MLTIQDIEARIIGELLYSGQKKTLEVAHILDETDFSDPACSILFGASVALVSEHKAVDLLSIQAFLQNNAEKLGTHFHRLAALSDAKTAISRLVLRASDLVTMHATRTYSNDLTSNCYFLKEEAQRRSAQEIILAAGTKLNDGTDVDEVIENGVRNLLSLSAKSYHLKSFIALEDAFDEAIKETEEELSGKVVRLSTGFPVLDSIIYGLEKGRLYAVAAEEKIGKSLFAYQIGLHAAKGGHSTAIITLEMRGGEIAKRYAGVNSGQDAKVRLNALERVKQVIGVYPLFIRDGSATSDKAFTLIHSLYAEKKVELVILDYLQLIELKGRDRVNEINDFVCRLKGLAMDLQIPVLLIAAVLNKQISNRGSRKPTPSDIRDTGRLANDADCLMMMWKPDERDENYLELFVARSRYSKLGRIGLLLDSDTLSLAQTELRQSVEASLQSYQPKRF